MKRRVASLIAVSTCAVLAGCYRRVEGPEGAVHSLEPYVPSLVIVAGLVIVAIGALMFLRQHRLAGGLTAVVGLLAIVALAPGMFQDHVVVGEDGFTSRHGFWWSPITHRVRYADLAGADVVVEENRRGGSKSRRYTLECQLKSGAQERVPIGDVMRQAITEIAVKLQGRGIPARIPPELPR